MIKFIAEIGSNHNQDFARCASLIHIAADIGCWGVKFQLFKAEKLYHPAHPDYKEETTTARGRELPEEWIPDIAKICEGEGLAFGCTPFYLEAVEVLAPHVVFLKISSFDILRKDLIQKCIDTGLPMMISFGLASFTDYRGVLDMYLPLEKLTLFHCVSKYPPHPSECGLKIISNLCTNRGGQTYKIGWSDHTAEPGVIHQAIAYGAEVIECHLDKGDGTGYESQYGHCWTPSRLVKVINDVKIGQSAGGRGMPVTEEELSQRADPSDGLRPIKEARK